eukprot:GHVS01097872.1.p2 GENE.GHVS01097872.1~~GHVS01097872.1.p2  ORF type:complete len:379 (-),score=50.69 GHVS01097872.1:2032-3168(-)
MDRFNVTTPISPSRCFFFPCYMCCVLVLMFCDIASPSAAAVVGTLFEEENKLCFEEPLVREEPCVKMQTVEEVVPCATRLVEKEECRYEDVELNKTCPQVKKIVKQHKCIKNQKRKKCWKEPRQKNKTCKKTIIRQEPYKCYRSVSSETCSVEEYKLHKMCHKTIMKSTSYMCYKKQPLCSKEHCKKTVVRDDPYPCRRTVHRAICTDANRRYRQGASYCPTEEVQEETTCYKPTTVETVDRVCMKQSCKERMQYKASTCQKMLPSLEQYPCVTPRRREKCTDDKKEEVSTCYRDIPEEVDYECPEVEWKQRCEVFDVKQIGECDRVVEETMSIPCKETRKQRVCEVETKQEKRTCYETNEVAQTLMCYESEFEKRCL